MSHAFAVAAILATIVPAPALSQVPVTQESGTIIGFVSDSSGQGIAGVQVMVLGKSAVISDSLGNFVVRATPTGRVLVRARKVGFTPEAVVALVQAGKTTSVPLVLVRLPQRLATVKAEAQPDSMQALRYHGIHKFDLFNLRRSHSIGGKFFTRDQIQDRFPAKLSDLLQGPVRRLPRCQIASLPGSGADVTASRYQLFIDDLPYGDVGEDFETLDAIPPDLVEGIEVYDSPSKLPVEAVGNACAAIFIWLRSTAADSTVR